MATTTTPVLPDPTKTAATPTGTAPLGTTPAPKDPAQANVYSTAPTQWNNTKEQTTAGQVESIIDKDSPLMQQAKTKALELMNGRGLLNSSMAIGAAQNAVISQATPIANADATQASNVNQYNATQSNQTIRDRDTALTQASGLNAQEYNKLLAQNLDNENKTQLLELEAKYKNQMQSSQSAQSLYSQISKNMSDILMTDSMDATSKQTAIKNQIALLNNGLGRLESVSELDLGQILDFSDVPGA